MPSWFLYTILTVLLWGGWGFASRLPGSRLSPEHTLVISTFGVLPILIALGLKGAARCSRAQRGPAAWALLAGLLGSAGNLALYRLMNAGERAATVVPLTALYPLITIALAVPILKERLSGWQKGGVALALGAIYLFNTTTDGATLDRWILLALLPTALWGVAALLQKLSAQSLSGEVSTFWFLLGLIPVASAMAALKGFPRDLSPSLWGLAVLIGLLLGLGNLTLLAAYASDGKASVITPLSSLYPIVTVPLAVAFLGEKVGAREGFAIALSLCSVAALSQERAAQTLTSPPASMSQ
ncbi:MAG: DMT family transporter [Verrucomicrobia bacterium]|nr:DMT family transporter [Verrucomicrobiota bacterium]MBI3867005.1 DMT family transporter [Verrucomicrobiota bacterium]